MNVAVVDIGTNSIHMLVVRVDADLQFHVIDRAKEMVRLGERTFETGRLDEETRRRALDALMRFRRLAEKRGVDRYLAVATSAVREAENGGAFLQEVLEATGIHPRVISGSEEARLIFKAVQSSLPLDEEPILVADLGGGSLEFACGSSRQLHWCTSLKLGVQRLEGVALADGEATPDTRRAVDELLARELAPIANRAEERKVKRCFVTSGSASAVLKLLRARGDASESRPSIPRKALAALDDEVAAMPRDKRLALPGLEPARADLVVPAIALFRRLADALSVDELHVSDRALREGVVQDFLDTHGAELQWELTEPNARRRAVLRFAERYHYDAPHAHHVAHLAERLFDDLRDFHGLGEDALELLEYGALLHDVGYVVAEKSHHKHTEYLVLHGLVGGFTEREIRMIAAIGRYHRKAEPEKSHENFASLGDEDREAVRKLASLLRLADGLDRSHGRAVGDVRARVTAEAVELEVVAEETADLEVWAAKRKSGLFEDTFSRAARFTVVRPAAPEVLADAAE